MKKKYYVNRIEQKNGDHEVHNENCQYLPKPLNRVYLGEFANCQDAIRVARTHYYLVDGCFYCCNSCHKK